MAIVNRGGIRVDLKAGVLTRGQIMAMLPFGNSLVAVNFTGKQLLDTLEVTASAPNTTNDWFDPPRVVPNAFSQVAGVRFAYDPKKDYGKKVVGAEYQATDGTWSAIVADKVYPIVTIDFLATGGDGLLKPPPALNGTQIILLTKLDDEVTQCWMKAGTVVPIVDDRICNLGESSSCSWLKTNTTSKPNGAAALGLPKALGALAVAAMFALLL